MDRGKELIDAQRFGEDDSGGRLKELRDESLEYGVVLDERTWEIVPRGRGSASRGGADRALRLRQFS